MMNHFQTVIERDNASHALHKVRSFTSWYSHGLPEGLALRRTLSKHRSAEAVVAAVEAHFARLARHDAAA